MRRRCPIRAVFDQPADAAPPRTVLPGGQTNAAALQSFPTTATATAGTYTWNVNIAAGTPVTLQLKDNTGAIAYSGILTIAANTE